MPGKSTGIAYNIREFLGTTVLYLVVEAVALGVCGPPSVHSAQASGPGSKITRR